MCTVDPPSNRVFLSYSNKDKEWADDACAAIESGGARCWIAPRDIAAGAEWGASIIAGIDACRVMVLILSDHANRSPQVRREVERAVSKGLVIIPCRVEDALPVGALEYALSNTHWLDLFTPPRQTQLERLVEAVRASGVAPPPEVVRPRSRARTSTRNRKWSWLAGGVLLSLAMVVAGFIMADGRGPNPSTAAGGDPRPAPPTPPKQNSLWLSASVEGAKLCDPAGVTLGTKRFQGEGADGRAQAAAEWVKKTLDQAFPRTEKELRVSAVLRRDPGQGMRHFAITPGDPLRQDRFWIFTTEPGGKIGHPEVAQSEEAVGELFERLAPTKEAYFHVYRPGYQLQLVSLEVDGTPAEVVMPRLDGPSGMSVIVRAVGPAAEAAEQLRARLGALKLEAGDSSSLNSKKDKYKDSLKDRLRPEQRLTFLREARVDAFVTVTVGDE